MATVLRKTGYTGVYKVNSKYEQISSGAAPATIPLEILLAPDKVEAGFRIHVAFDVQCGAQALGAAEENAGFRGRVDLPDGFENCVPVWTTEVGGGAETGNGVLFGVGVVDHDVRCVVCFDFGCEVLGIKVSYVFS